MYMNRLHIGSLVKFLNPDNLESSRCDWERAREILLKRLEQKQPVGAIVNHVTGTLIFQWEEPDLIER